MPTVIRNKSQFEQKSININQRSNKKVTLVSSGTAKSGKSAKGKQSTIQNHQLETLNQGATIMPLPDSHPGNKPKKGQFDSAASGTSARTYGFSHSVGKDSRSGISRGSGISAFTAGASQASSKGAGPPNSGSYQSGTSNITSPPVAFSMLGTIAQNEPTGGDDRMQNPVPRAGVGFDMLGTIAQNEPTGGDERMQSPVQIFGAGFNMLGTIAQNEPTGGDERFAKSGSSGNAGNKSPASRRYDSYN